MSTYLNLPRDFMPDGSLPTTGGGGVISASIAVTLSALTFSASASFATGEAAGSGYWRPANPHHVAKPDVTADIAVALPALVVTATATATAVTDEEAAQVIMALFAQLELQDAA